MNNRKQSTHTWKVWLTALIAGILLPLFGVRSTAQAAAWRTVGHPEHAVALTLDIRGDDGKGGGHDDSADDNSGSGDTNSADDNGGTRGDDSVDDNDSADDNGGTARRQQRWRQQ